VIGCHYSSLTTAPVGGAHLVVLAGIEWIWLTRVLSLRSVLPSPARRTLSINCGIVLSRSLPAAVGRRPAFLVKRAHMAAAGPAVAWPHARDSLRAADRPCAWQASRGSSLPASRSPGRGVPRARLLASGTPRGAGLLAGRDLLAVLMPGDGDAAGLGLLMHRDGQGQHAGVVIGGDVVGV